MPAKAVPFYFAALAPRWAGLRGRDRQSPATGARASRRDELLRQRGFIRRLCGELRRSDAEFLPCRLTGAATVAMGVTVRRQPIRLVFVARSRLAPGTRRKAGPRLLFLCRWGPAFTASERCPPGSLPRLRLGYSLCFTLRNSTLV